MTEGFFFIKLKRVLNFRYYLGKLDDELAGDLIYKFKLCGIPGKWARAEFDGLVLGLYVGEYGVRDINLFYCIGVEGDDGEGSLGVEGDDGEGSLGDLGILDDELAGDLIYKFELCGIPGKWARAKYDG
ncbi:hypothetical protein Tco_0804997 [Tanacetum coccineum]